jgi:putative addiction module component (TIGR02574 family)
MTSKAKRELLEMSVPEKLKLIGELWDSIEEGAEIELSEEQKVELEKRWRDHKDHPEKFASWDVVRKRVFRKRR